MITAQEAIERLELWQNSYGRYVSSDSIKEIAELIRPQQGGLKQMYDMAENRLEEIRMALSCDLPEDNPYDKNTIESSIFNLRKECEQLKSQLAACHEQFKRIWSTLPPRQGGYSGQECIDEYFKLKDQLTANTTLPVANRGSNEET